MLPILTKALKGKKLIICTDATAILGIGDQGYGGIEIAFGKGKVDTIGGGVNPHHIAHVMLDMGTNNDAMLDNPNYRGLKEMRPAKSQYYDNFMRAFVYTVKNISPRIFLHWEDFTSRSAWRNLK